MNLSKSNLLLAFVITATTLLIATPTFAQSDTDADAALQRRLTEVREQLQVVEAATDNEPAVREQALGHYRAALALLEQAQRDAHETLRFRQAGLAAQTEAEALKQQLQAGPAIDISISAVSELTVNAEKLAEQLESAQQRQASLQQRLTTISQALATQRDRVEPADRALATTQVELTELLPTTGSAVAPLAGTDQTVPVSLVVVEAQQSLQAARRVALNNHIAVLEQEIQSRAPQIERLQLQRAAAERSLVAWEAQIAKLQEALNAERRRQAAAAAAKVEQSERLATSKSAVVRAATAANTTLSQEQLRVIKSIDGLAQMQTQLAEQVRRLDARYQSVRQQLDIAGLSDALGPLLRKERYELPDIRQHRSEAPARETQLVEARLRQFQLDEQVLDLADLDVEIERLLTEPSVKVESLDTRATAVRELRSLLSERRRLLAGLLDAYASYIDQLQTFEQTQAQLIESAGKYSQLLDEKLFWLASVERIDLDWLGRLRGALVQLLAPARWLQVVQTLQNGIALWPGLMALLLAAWAAVLLADWHLRDRLTKMVDRIGNVNRDHFGLTVQAVVITLLLALPIPLLLLLPGSLLTVLGDESGFGHAVGYGLLGAGVFSLIVHGLQQLCRADGLAERHLGWSAQACRVLRNNLWWYLPIGLPCAFIVLMTEAVAEPLFRDTLGRLAFCVGAGALVVLLARVLLPGRGALAPYLAERRGGWTWRFRYWWYAGLVAVPVLGVGLAAWGYYYTAQMLLNRFFLSASLLLEVLVAVGLVFRWLRIEQRRLAWSRMRAKREALLAARAKSKEEGGAAAVAGDEGSIPIEPDVLDLETISDQSQGLIKLMAFSGAGLGLWLIWDDLLPALTVFDGVTLWHQAITTEAGTEVTAITLGRLGLAAVLLALALFIARNLPGLLEIAVLQRFAMDAGSRYALTTITGYLITIIGVVTALNVIGIGWQKAQWLVAALSVGLGFGLQEIFANFVSGLIILLERPIRVGDTVTLGNFSGTVTRIRIRATTITDWDRKETVIPNKTFITTAFTNWTLTDPITRVIIPVGVAYNADTAVVHKALLAAAEAHPLVLKEPAPAVLLLAFGDSALNFEVRVFARELIDRLTLIHELHQRILDTLREQGVEIPFPQRDVHLRGEEKVDSS